MNIPLLRHCSCAVALLLMVLLVPIYGLAQDNEALRSGVVRIKALDNGKEKIGAGFVVRKDADAVWIVTAAHVVVDDHNPKVEFYKMFSLVESERIVCDCENPRGVALLKVVKGFPDGIAALPFSETDLRLDDEKLVIIGHPPVEDWNTIIDGYVSGIKFLYPILKAPIDDGNSGGPVLKNGKVVGMVDRKATGVGGYGEAVPISFIRKTLENSKFVLQTGNDTQQALPPVPKPPDCAYCPEMVSIPGGSFMMGSNANDTEAEDDEKPQHNVEVKAFSMGKFEVTKAQYAAFIADNRTYQDKGCYAWDGTSWVMQADKSWRDPGFPQTDAHPVTCVSFDDAQAYIQWLNVKTKQKYRLPTEAEWEYAARASTTTRRFWGDDPSDACLYANGADQTAQKTFTNWTGIHECEDGFVYTAPVGHYKPNKFGLYDMLGNAWEWTCSGYSKKYNNSEKKCINNANVARVLRGGSWYNYPLRLRSAYRLSGPASVRFLNLGFRLVQD